MRSGNSSMDMAQCLAEIRPAVEVILPAIWADLAELDKLSEEVRRLTARTEAEYARVESMLSVDPDDEDGIATGHHWDTYFGVDKERYYKNRSLEELQQSIDLKRFSLNVLSGSVLQIGKQGMSIVRNGLQGSADGRFIGSQPLKSIIWQGRNQAMHWEEGKLSKAVDDCFTTLAAEIDPKFANHKTESMAFNVVQLLGWTTVKEFAADLASLAR